MKWIGVILILVATLLSALSYLIHFVHVGFFDLSILYPTNQLFIRYGEVLFGFGFIALWIGVKRDFFIKWISLLIATLSLTPFFLVELNVFDSYTFIPNLLVTLRGLVIISLLWRIKVKECPLLTIKGSIIIIPITIFLIALHILSSLPYSEFDSMPKATESILPIFQFIYYYGLFIFFTEWYREAFLYKNEVLYNI